MRYFNDTLSNKEKMITMGHPTWLIRGFRESVQESGLVYIPLI